MELSFVDRSQFSVAQSYSNEVCVVLIKMRFFPDASRQAGGHSRR